MKHDTADELHVVVNHIPHYFVAAGNPVVAVECLVALDCEEVLAFGCKFAVEVGGSYLNGFVAGEAACRFAHDGKHFRQIAVEFFFEHFEDVLLDAVDLFPVRLAVFVFDCLNLFLDVGNLLSLGGNAFFERGTDFGDAVAESIIAQRFQRGVNLVDFRHDWLYFAQVAL